MESRDSCDFNYVKHKFSNILFMKCEIWLGKASFCFFFYLQKKCRRNYFFLFLVYSKCYYSISVRLTVILTVEQQTSECHLSKETNTMHIIQMAQEQHAIYFGYAFFRRLGKFYRNRKELTTFLPSLSVHLLNPCAVLKTLYPI